MRSADAIVCGAGVVGCAIARTLAESGVRVVLLDRAGPASEASGAAAGLLTHQADLAADSPFARMRRHGGELYPGFIARLRDETGIDVFYARCGTLRVPADPADAAEMDALLRWQSTQGWRLERVSGDALHELSGGALAPDLVEAIHFPDEAVVDNRELVRALLASAERSGARFRIGTARAILRSGDLCTGLATDGGDLSAGAVVIASGAWSDFDPALPFRIPVRPVRGQIVEIAETSGALPKTLLQGGFYVAPRERGRILLGSTIEEAGFDRRVTLPGLQSLTSRALALAPRLARASFVGAWAGLRPAAPDGLPILGESPLRRLYLATAHFRNGLLLAPATAAAITRLVREGRPDVDLAPFSLERFGGPDGSGSSDGFRFTAGNASW